MNDVRALCVALGSALIAGCAAWRGPESPATVRPAAPPSSDERMSAVGAKVSGAAAKRARDGSPAVPLTAYQVRESAFSDFGMSVRTNVEVKWGGRIQWMQVSGINAGGSAAAARLEVGDRILAIAGRLIGEFDRDAMLDALFQRKKGEVLEFLVLAQNDPLPRFVHLVAGKQGG